MWRMKAKYETVCQRCRGYIKVGVWIVQEQGDSRWSHAVCPGDLRRPVQPAEPTVVEEWRPVFDGEGNQTGMEAVTNG